jgi:hypothetical protein
VVIVSCPGARDSLLKWGGSCKSLQTKKELSRGEGG